MKIEGLDHLTIEYLAYWEGGMTAGRLAAVAGVNRPHAQTFMVKPYDELPGTRGRLKRHKKEKVFDEDRGFGPALMPTRPSSAILFGRAMHWFASFRRERGDPELKGPKHPAVTIEDIPGISSMHLRHEGFRALHVGCAKKKAVRIIYRSNADASIPMTVSPHALVVGCAREHFRCHVDERGADGALHRPLPAQMTGSYWADIVPWRVLAVEGFVPDAYVSGKADMEWKTTETLAFALEPEVPDHLLDIVDAEMSGVPGYSPPHLILENIRLLLRPRVL